jgi:hypothetical protein
MRTRRHLLSGENSLTRRNAPTNRYQPAKIGGRLASQPTSFGIIGGVTSADRESERLTALGGLAALSLDALSSVAYGPEAILVVLVTAGTASLRYSLPITGAIVVLLAALIFSYRQVIEAFPNGGGAYAVSQRHLGKAPSLVAAASLIVD